MPVDITAVKHNRIYRNGSRSYTRLSKATAGSEARHTKCDGTTAIDQCRYMPLGWRTTWGESCGDRAEEE